MLQLDEPEDKSQIDRRRCGELASEEEGSDEESDMDGDEPVIVQTDTRAADSGYVTPAPSVAGTVTPSGISSTVINDEEMETMELRKERAEEQFILSKF